MTGEMKQRKNGVHFVNYVSHGGKYLEVEAICSWQYPKHTTQDIYVVTCPECLRIILEKAKTT